jgi:hypothetical protein
MTNPQDIPTFTCSLPRFLNYLLGNTFERCEIEPEDAIILQAKDPSEQFLHIEFPPTGKPVCWRISSWRSNNLRIQQLKAKSEAERIELCKMKENAARIAKKMAAFMNLPYDVVYPIAYTKIAKTKNVTAAKNWDVNLDL